jgi:hypothetical protein
MTTSTPSLRAQRSNPESNKKNWIASSQELLAMTETIPITPTAIDASIDQA